MRLYSAAKLVHLKQKEQLEELGFTGFEQRKRSDGMSTEWWYLTQDHIELEVNSIDDLFAIMDKTKEGLILQFTSHTNEKKLVLYNDYHE